MTATFCCSSCFFSCSFHFHSMKSFFSWISFLNSPILLIDLL